MCGRYVSPDQSAIERAWRLRRSNPLPFVRRFNVAPTDPVPLLVLEDGMLTLHSARWGLIPGWWREEKPPKLSFNARVEEAAAKPMWRDAMRGARCLLPALGWYEWRQPDKQPYYFHRRDGRPVALAGLFSRYRGRITCAVLSTAAQGRLEAVHERMPVFLDEAGEAAWLESGAVASAPDEIEFHPVRKAVNTAAVDSPDLIEPLAA